MDLSELPLPILIQTVLDFPLQNLVQICSINQDLNNKLCNNDEFWQKKYLHDYGEPAEVPVVWKEAYHQQDTQLYGFGQNTAGQLGIGNTQNQLKPVPIPDTNKIQKISAGMDHSLLLNAQGQVLSFGDNHVGQLGIRGVRQRYRTTLIMDVPRIKDISAGQYFSLILDQDGHVWSFGHNSNGQLGLGNNITRSEPVMIPNLPKMKAISTGSNNSLILSEEGQVYAFGSNEFGALGLGDDRDRNTPTLINLPPEVRIKKISAGTFHNLLLVGGEGEEQGQVYVFGLAGGQLGLGDDQNRNIPTLIQIPFKVKDIATGHLHSLILSEEGRVYSFGWNEGGQLGLGDQQDRNVPTLIPFTQDVKMKKIAAYGNHSFIVSQNGQVYAFGENVFGELGLGDQQNRNIPTLVPNLENIRDISTGTFHTLVLTGPRVLYSTIQTLIERNLLQRSEILDTDSEGNTLMRFTDNYGNTYLSEVTYDYDTNQIFPPVYPEGWMSNIWGTIKSYIPSFN